MFDIGKAGLILDYAIIFASWLYIALFISYVILSLAISVNKRYLPKLRYHVAALTMLIAPNLFGTFLKDVKLSDFKTRFFEASEEESQ